MRTYDENFVDLQMVSKMLIKQGDVVNTNVLIKAVWDRDFKHVVINLHSNHYHDYYTNFTKYNPPEYTKLIEAKTAMEAIKFYSEFEEKELPQQLEAFSVVLKKHQEERQKELQKRRKENDAKFQEESQKAIAAHDVKVGDLILNIKTKQTGAVTEVHKKWDYFTYSINFSDLNPDNKFCAVIHTDSYNLFRSKFTEKGKERVQGYLYLGKPEATKKKTNKKK